MAVNEAELRIVLKVLGQDLLRGMDEMKSSVDRATISVRDNFKETDRVVERSMGSIRERVTVGLSGIQGSIRAFGTVAEIALAVLTVQHAVEGIIGAQQQWAKGQEHLHEALGLSLTDTAALAIAAKEADAPIEQLDLLIRGLGLHLNSSEKEFSSLGIAVRDARTGAFLPLFTILQNSLHTIDEYRAGTDQLIIAQRLFGRGATAETIDGLRKTAANLEEAKVKAREFGLVLGEDGIVRAQAFTRAQADLGFAFLSVKNIVAEELRPELQKVLEFVTEMVRDGRLAAWAREGAKDVQGLSEDIIKLGTFLVDHARFIQSAAIAWGVYKAALLTAGETEALLGYLRKIQAAATAIQISSGLANLGAAAGFAGTALLPQAELAGGRAAGAALNELGVSMRLVARESVAMETAIGAATVRIGSLRAFALATAESLGTAGIIGAVLAGIAIIITYADKWGDVGEALEKVGDKARDATAPEITALHKLLNKAVDDDHFGPWLHTIVDDLHLLSEAFKAGGEDSDGFFKNMSLAFAEHIPFVREFMEMHQRLREEAATTGEHGAGRTFDIEETGPFQREVFGRRLGAGEGGAYVSGIGPPTAEEARLIEPAGTKTAGLSAEQQITAEKAKFNELRRLQEEALAAVQGNEAAKLEIIKHYSDLIKALPAPPVDPTTGVQVKKEQLETQQRSLTEAIRKAAEERQRIGETTLKQEEARALHSAEVDKRTVEERRKLGLLTEEEAARSQIAIEDRRFEIVRSHLEAELNLQAGGAEKAAELRKRLQDATTPGEVQGAFAFEPQVNPQRFLEQLDKLDTAVREHKDNIAALEFQINDRKLQQQAAEIKAVFDTAFSGIEASVRRFAQVLVEGNTTAAEQIGQLRAELHSSQLDMHDVAVASGRFSDEFVTARNREIDAQNRLNTAMEGQSRIMAALAAAGREFYSVATQEAEKFVLEVVKMQALRIAAEISGDQAVLAEDKLTGAERLALKVGNWALELTGLKAKVAQNIATEHAEVAQKTVAEGQKAAAVTTSQTVQVAATAAGTDAKDAIETASTQKSILKKAYDAAAGAYAATSDIPIIGPYLAPVVAAAAFAFVVGTFGAFTSEKGSDETPEGKIGILHPEERVLSPETATTIRQLTKTPEGRAILAGDTRKGFDVGASGYTGPVPGGSIVLPKELANEVRRAPAEAATQEAPRGAAPPEAATVAAPTTFTGGPLKIASRDSAVAPEPAKPQAPPSIVGAKGGKSVADLTLGDVIQLLLVKGAVHAQTGVRRIPADNTLVVAHEGERVLSASEVRAGVATEAVSAPLPSAAPVAPEAIRRDTGEGNVGGGVLPAGGGDLGGKAIGEKGGKGAKGDKGDQGDTKVKHEGKVEHEHKDATGGFAGNQTISAFAAISAAATNKTQPVSVVAAPATVQTKPRGGELTATIPHAVSTVPADGVATPVSDIDKIKNVQVINTPMRVAFTAIGASVTFFTPSPLGIIPVIGTGIQFLSAFGKGGEVPEDMVAKLHEREIVMDAPLATGFRRIIEAQSRAQGPLTEPGGVRITAATLSLFPERPAAVRAAGERGSDGRDGIDGAGEVHYHNETIEVKTIDREDTQRWVEANRDLVHNAATRVAKDRQSRRGRRV